MSTTDDIAARLARIVAGLVDLVAAKGLARGLGGPLIILIAIRLNRLVARFAASAQAAAKPRRGAKPRPARAHVPSPLPRRFAWLLRVLPGTGAAASQLRHLLDDPDMTALIESRPATGRALRPLCHLLGIRPPPALRRKVALRAPLSPRPRARPRARPAPPPAPSPLLPRRRLARPPGNRACPLHPDLRLDTG
ncbi:hypothetical protein ACMV_32980 [Acidiphilium multivorum AIU301]|uniref:Uncharacterized protein n=2 Tax=Acidiphilium multivorum TaxID=62140 RepID=F0J6M8_ACIMA|nr:hypothetical protein [Acidiphilium multivorum]BAJ82645.1 hypothetical protein ACMV_32980 [Acidiphilium multivorum AIU301]